MNAKTLLVGALILAGISTVPVYAQMNPAKPMGEPANDKPKDDPEDKPKDDKKPSAPAAAQAAGTTPSQTAGWVSPWIAYSRPDCCGGVGNDGPILSEYYFRTGLSQPVATGILHESLQGGWMNEVGGRSLFFNKSGYGAWTIDYGLAWTLNNGSNGPVFNQRINFNPNPGNPAALQVDQVETPVTIRAYNRTSLNTSLGYEYYLGNPANCEGTHWRVGFDSGGRWGASRVELNDLGQLNNPDAQGNTFIGYKRLYDVYGAWFVSLHTDLEIPFNQCCVLTTGFRAEWNYNWSDVFSGQNGDLQDVNLLWQIGIRY